MTNSSVGEKAYTQQERKFIEAIDRILAGKPLEKSLKAQVSAGKTLVLNLTNVAQEAGYARTYLYKNRDTMASVWARIDAHANPPSPAPTGQDIIRTLREQNARLRAERNLAIDAARRCMQETIRAREDSSGAKAKTRLEGEVKALRAKLSQLEAENARLRSGTASDNIIPLRR